MFGPVAAVAMMFGVVAHDASEAASSDLYPALQVIERPAGDIDDFTCDAFAPRKFGFQETQTLNARLVKDADDFVLTLEVARLRPRPPEGKRDKKVSADGAEYYDIIFAYHVASDFNQPYMEVLSEEYRPKLTNLHKKITCASNIRDNKLVLHAPFFFAGDRPTRMKGGEGVVIPILVHYVPRQSQPEASAAATRPEAPDGTAGDSDDVASQTVAPDTAGQQAANSRNPAGGAVGAGLKPGEAQAVRDALQQADVASADTAAPTPAGSAEPPAAIPPPATHETEVQADGPVPAGEHAAVKPAAQAPPAEPRKRAYPWTLGFRLAQFVDAEEVFVVERVECSKAGNFFVGAVAQVAPDQARSKDEAVAVRRRAMYAANQFYGAGGDPADRSTVEASIDPSHFWCIPKREVCYKQIEFGQFGVAVRKDELERVERDQIYNLRHGLAAAIQTMAADLCLNEDNLAGRRTE